MQSMANCTTVSTHLLRWLLCVFLFVLSLCFRVASAQNDIQVQQIVAASLCPTPYAIAVNNQTGVIFAACFASGIIAINGSSIQQIATSSQCTNPTNVAVNSVTGVVVAACGTNGILAISGLSIQTIATASQCTSPRGVAVNAATGVTLVACYNSGIIAINGASILTIATPSQCPGANDVVVSSETGIVYATCYAFGVIAINGSTVSTIATQSQCPNALRLTVNRATGIVYVACYAGSVIAINGTSIQAVTNSSQCLNPSGVAINIVTNTIYAGCSKGLIAINQTSIQTIANSQQCATPQGMAVSGRTGIIYAACASSIIASNQSVVAQLTLAPKCQGMAVSALPNNNSVVYAGCFNSGVIAIKGSSILMDTVSCSSVNGIAIDTVRGKVFAACSTVVQIVGSSALEIATSSQCTTPTGIAVDVITGTVIAACSKSGIVAINGSSVQTIVTSSQCPNAWGVAVNGATIYAACLSGAVIAISSTSIIPISTTCLNPSGVAVNAVTGIVYAICTGGSAAVVSINGTSSVAIATSVQCSHPYAVTVNTASGIVYVACNTLGLIAINGASVLTIVTPSQCPMTYGVTVNNVTGIIYAACYGDGGSVVSVQTFGNRSPDSIFLDGTNSVNGGQFMSLNAVTLPSNVSGGLTWYIDDAIIPTCVQLPIVNGSCSCVTNVQTPGARKVYAMTLGDSTFKYGFVSSPFYLRVGYCLIPPNLVNSQNQTDCLNQQYPVPPSSTCSAACIEYYPGPTITYTCVNGQWVGLSSTCQLPLVSLQSLPSSTPASISSTNLEIAPLFPPKFAPATIFISCTGDGAVSGSPMTFPVNSTKSQFWSYTSPPTSIISPVVCTFTAAGANASQFRVPPPQSVAIVTYCNVCPPGQQNGTDPATGLPICKKCSSGNASPLGVECFPCEPGTATNSSGQAYCSPCSVGTFQPNPGALTCLPCPFDSIASTSGATECTSCAAGSIPSAGFASCVACSPGTYLSNDGFQVECIPCSVGRYAPNASSETCPSCPNGQVALTPGQAFCTQCKPGEETAVDPATGLTFCSPCPAGSYSPGGDPCLPCHPGFYSSQSSTFACSACSQGSASNITGLAAKSCPACDAGTYQSESGSTSCIECAAQRFSSEPGSISCQLCSSKVNANRTRCEDQTCENANYFYNALTSVCEPCSLGSCAIGGTCAICPVSYYTPQVGAACTSCQGVEGLVCSNGLASVNSGYWAFVIDGVDGSGAPSKVFQTAYCPADFCPGSLLQQDAGNSSSSFLPSSSIQLCTPPRLNTASNVLCGECEPGYIAWGNQCVACTGTNGGLVFVCVLISFLFVVFLFRTSGEATAGAVPILLFFAQTAALEASSATQWLSWAQFLNLGLHSSSSCLAPLNVFDQMLLSLFIPVILVGEVGVLAMVHYCFHRLHRNSPLRSMTDSSLSSSAASQSRATSPSQVSALSRQMAVWLANAFSWNQYIACIMSVLLFCYTQVAVTSFQYLNCVDVGSSRVVFSTPTINCHSAEYRAYLPPVIIAIILYIIGFPLGVLTLLWMHKETLFVSVAAPRASAADIKASMAGFFVRWSPLFQMFHPRAWFWQPLLLLRRSMYVLVSVLLVQQPSTRFMAFSFLNFGSLLFHQVVRPFESKKLNRIESASYALLVSISIILGGAARPYSDATQAILLLLVVLPTAALFGYIVWREWQEFQRRNSSPQPPSDVGADTQQHKDIEMIVSPANAGTTISADDSNEDLIFNADAIEFQSSPNDSRRRESSVVHPAMLDPSVPSSDSAQL